MMTQTALNSSRKAQFVDRGLIDYDVACQFQKQCVEKVQQGGSPTVILCEHPAVITCGRMSRAENILAPEDDIQKKGVIIRGIDRGGDITLHAPGQLVVYPIFDLNYFGRDLHLHLRRMEDVAISLLADLGIAATRHPSATGVWVGNKKLVSMGVGVRKWVSYHGMAININTDLDLFSLIRPCGLDVAMTSVAALKHGSSDMSAVKEKLIGHMTRVFKLELDKE